jgi:hypothetical protein
MDSTALINSVGIGAVIFAGLILLWFLRIFFKRRMADQQSNQIAVASQKTSWEEKRKHARVAISWPAQLQSPQGPMTVQLKDISLGGAFVVCPHPLPLTEKFQITVNPSNDKEISLNAVVVWSNSNVPEDKVINRGMGIKFIENSDENRNGLNQVIRSYIEENVE